MAGTGSKTQLWHLVVTHRQKNRGGYFYILCMQPNGHQHPSRKRAVCGKCPYHIAEEARGTEQGHDGQGGHFKRRLSALSRLRLCPGERRSNVKMLSDE